MKAVVTALLLVVASAAYAQSGGTEWRFLNDSDVLDNITNLGGAPVLTLWPADVTWGTNPPELKIYPDGLVQRSGGNFEPASATLPAEVVRSWVAKIVETGVIDLTGHQLQSIERKAREKYRPKLTQPQRDEPTSPWDLDMIRVRHHRSTLVLEVLIVLGAQGPVHRVIAYSDVIDVAEEHPEVAEFQALADVLRPLLDLFFDDERFQPDNE